MGQEKKNRYQLRQAAGVYWLIDMEQTGVPFVKPVPVNEMGAGIWKLLNGVQEDQVAEILCREYGIGREQAVQDVKHFLKDLKKHGIII